MRIGINLLFLIPGIVGGTQTYALSLLNELAKIDTTNDYTIFINVESTNLELPLAPNFNVVRCPVRANSRSIRYAWEQCILPFQLIQHRIDVVHSPGYVCPLNVLCANVVTICDVNYKSMASLIPNGKRQLLSFFIQQSAKRSDHILTLSEFSKQEIIKYLGVNAKKVTVGHLSSRLDDIMPTQLLEWDNLVAKYGLTKPYVMAFSGPSPHKNIVRLVKAFNLLEEELPHTLVLVGTLPNKLDNASFTEAIKLSKRVITTGYVPDQEVIPLLANADLFVFPSWYEGFGLPIIDAQRIGVPVISSNAASLPEIAGKGALYFDPFSIEDIARAIRECLSNPSLRELLSTLGRENAHRFSWEKTARTTLAVFERLVG